MNWTARKASSGILFFLLLIPVSLYPQIVTPRGTSDRDNPLRRELWFNSGRKINGQNSAASLHRAYRQKMALRARRLQAARGIQASAVQNFAGTSWSPLGPAPLSSNASGSANEQNYGPVTGRVTAVAIDPNDATGNTVYIGGAYGGVWKSRNAASADPAAVTWTPLTDDQPTLSTGAIAVKPGNSTVVLVGTGEPNVAIDSYYGLGILRSTDGGASWSLIASADNGATAFTGMGFSKIVFSPDNPELVVAGANSFTIFQFLSAGMPGSGGLFYSTDAGATWRSARVTDPTGATDQTPVTDIVYSHSNHTFYAALAFHGIYSSSDGVNWTRLAVQPGGALLNAGVCPAAPHFSGCPIFRGVLAVNPVNGDLFAWYVSFNGSNLADNGIYKLVSNTNNWLKVNQAGMINCGDGGIANGCGASDQGWYNLELLAVPNGSATDLWAGAVNLFKCTMTSLNPLCGVNPFANLTHVYGCTPVGAPAHVHPDQHAIAYALVGNRVVMYFGNDGGIYRTLNGFDARFNGSCAAGNNPFENLDGTMGSLTQFTGIALHPTDSTVVLGGTQDNGSPAMDEAHAGNTGTNWLAVNAGDGGFSAINPAAPNEWFTYVPEPAIYRCTAGINCLAQNFQKVVGSGAPTDLGGDAAAFYMPYMLDAGASSRLIAGTCRVWRGNKDGTGFSALSYNFSTLSAEACDASGTLISALAAGGPVTARGSQVIYAGTGGEFSCGGFAGSPCEVWVTTNADGGPGTWVSRLTTQFPVSSIALDPSDPTGSTAYVTVMGFGTAHVIRTMNAGRTWTDLTGNLPDAPADAIVVDPRDPNTVYVGTDVGVFVTSDAGSNWTELGPADGAGHLPNVAVASLKIFDSNGTRLLRAATHGRGVWQFALALPPPDYQVRVTNPSLMVLRGGTMVLSGNLKALNGYASAVTVSCSGSSLPSTCSSATLTPTGGSGAPFSISVGSNSSGVYHFNLQAVGSDSNTVSHLFAVTVEVGDFSLSMPSTVSVNRGSSSSAINLGIVVNGSQNFAATATLACNGLPAGVQCGFFPPGPLALTTSAPSQTQLTLSASSAALAGTYPVTVTATGTGGATRSQTLQVVVTVNPDYSAQISQPSLSGKPGATVTAGLTFAPANGYSGTVALSCAISGITQCSVSPASVNLATGAKSATMTIAVPKSAVAGGYPGTIQTQDASGQPAHTISFLVMVNDFSMVPSTTQLTVKRGRTGTVNLSIAGVAGAYSEAIRLSCSGLPALSSCAFSASTVTPGSATAVVTMSVKTASDIASLAQPRGPVYALWLAFPLAAMVFAGAARQRGKICALVSLAFLLIVILTSCGGGGGGGGGGNGTSPLPPASGTPAGTYTITVTGQSGALSHSTPITLLVQ